ncbi:MAG: YdcF family protein [Solirubrobacteraceae bacterium]|nr:YdcF family protein [Solirubrobacteraceae bacterium]
MRVPRPVRIVLAATVAAVLLVMVLNLYVVVRGGGAVDRVEDVDAAPVAIVLGALVHEDGRMSAMLADRVARTVELWRSGKVARILVSGGTRPAEDYDEPATMRAALRSADVPDRVIAIDDRGDNTYASMRRAHDAFGVRRAIAVTQGFHIRRALFLARSAGIDASGLTSDLRGYGPKGRQSGVREVLARLKAVKDSVLRPDVPREGGRPLDVGGG